MKITLILLFAFISFNSYAQKVSLEDIKGSPEEYEGQNLRFNGVIILATLVKTAGSYYNIDIGMDYKGYDMIITNASGLAAVVSKKVATQLEADSVKSVETYYKANIKGRIMQMKHSNGDYIFYMDMIEIKSRNGSKVYQ